MNSASPPRAAPYLGGLYGICHDCGRRTYARRHPVVADAAICPACDWQRTFGVPLTYAGIEAVWAAIEAERKRGSTS